MIDLYTQIKLLHIVAVSISGSLFVVRAIAVQRDKAWAMARSIRYCSYAVDTVLLTAAVLLMVIVHEYPGADCWLTIKLALVVVYIALGTLALKRASTRGTQRLCALGALLVFAMIVGVAIMHHLSGFVASG